MRVLILPALLITSLAFAQAKPTEGKPAPGTKPAAGAKTAAVDFEKQILPILESRCVDCHSAGKTGPDGRTRRPKGGVSFDGKDSILASKKGTLVVAKKS